MWVNTIEVSEDEINVCAHYGDQEPIKNLLTQLTNSYNLTVHDLRDFQRLIPDFSNFPRMRYWEPFVPGKVKVGGLGVKPEENQFQITDIKEALNDHIFGMYNLLNDDTLTDLYIVSFDQESDNSAQSFLKEISTIIDDYDIDVRKLYKHNAKNDIAEEIDFLRGELYTNLSIIGFNYGHL